MCQISQKKTYAEWGHWANDFVDELNAVQWRRFGFPFCIMGSHVEQTNCTSGDNSRLVDWVVASSETEIIFSDARHYCWTEHDGIIWDEATGDIECLRPIFELMNGDFFWIGISDEDHEGVWLNQKGEDFTSLITFWKPFQPNDGG